MLVDILRCIEEELVLGSEFQKSAASDYVPSYLKNDEKQIVSANQLIFSLKFRSGQNLRVIFFCFFLRRF